MLTSITWAVAAWRRIPQPRNMAARLLGAQLWVALVVEVLGTALSLMHAPNAWLYDLYVVVEFLLLLGLARALELLPFTGFYLRLLWQRANRVKGPLFQDRLFWVGLGVRSSSGQ
ncbi:MAG: hypothetical protein IPK99_10765 [Flavobacteriales bacterium]|nr:hypothetical protein [Flavobacteriales bacterium]